MIAHLDAVDEVTVAAQGRKDFDGNGTEGEDQSGPNEQIHHRSGFALYSDQPEQLVVQNQGHDDHEEGAAKKRGNQAVRIFAKDDTK